MNGLLLESPGVCSSSVPRTKKREERLDEKKKRSLMAKKKKSLMEGEKRGSGSNTEQKCLSPSNV